MNLSMEESQEINGGEVPSWVKKGGLYSFVFGVIDNWSDVKKGFLDGWNSLK